ncbi:MAG TPA: hypothetical protein DCQ98_08480 [Planctomycetaceae bacterium]|nr:hypothetical protein [Planctomycetaceae bacterium]HRF00181.1 hypothetical protein [Pirellulaceae bacterium]
MESEKNASSNDLSPRERSPQEFDIAAVDRALRERRTVKVMASSVAPPPTLRADGETAIREAIAAAGWTPFHYPAAIADAAAGAPIEPWRVTLLDDAACRRLASLIEGDKERSSRAGKIPSLLRGCGHLLLVTWLPEPEEREARKREEIDREHLLAVGAFVQSLMIALQVRRFGTYWSSGGVLVEPELLSQVGADRRERLAAALFVDHAPQNVSDGVERVPGKLRERRSPAASWTRSWNGPAGS